MGNLIKDATASVAAFIVSLVIVVALVAGLAWGGVALYRGVISPAKEANTRTDIRRNIDLAEERQKAIINNPARRAAIKDAFYTQYASIETARTVAANAESALEAFEAANPAPRGFQAQSQYTQLLTQVTGAKNILVDSIKQYNADRANDQKGPFCDCPDLPSIVELEG